MLMFYFQLGLSIEDNEAEEEEKMEVEDLPPLENENAESKMEEVD